MNDFVDFTVSTLGEPRYRSPLPLSTVPDDGVGNFVPDATRVLHTIRRHPGQEEDSCSFELAGAREHLFFNPADTRAAIVTCGGLCPGLNNVIRTLYFELIANYGIREVLGIRFGYQGLNPQKGVPPIRLDDQAVAHIHRMGGTILGTSRGPQEPGVVVDFLCDAQIDMLFCVGGDGTQRGAHDIAQEVARRRVPIAVIGIPKTIDNDVRFSRRSFGFATAVAEAERIIHRAHTEAIAVRNGIGLVKLMGREAGFIAAVSSMVSGDVNFTLVPEITVQLEGEKGLLAKLERRLAARQHAVIVVAEGAGQDLIPDRREEYDASGNRKLGDIGLFLKQQITAHFASRQVPVNLRYFDPSYSIRSCPASSIDSLLCEQYARNAAHAAMAGKTDILIGLWHGEFIHVPLPASIGQSKRLSPEDDLWISVLAITGQEKW